MSFLKGPGFVRRHLWCRGRKRFGHSRTLHVGHILYLFLTFKCRPLRATFGMSAYFGQLAATFGVCLRLISSRHTITLPRRIGGDHDFRVAWPPAEADTTLFLFARALWDTEIYCSLPPFIRKTWEKRNTEESAANGLCGLITVLRFSQTFKHILPLVVLVNQTLPSVSLAHSFRTCRSH